MIQNGNLFVLYLFNTIKFKSNKQVQYLFVGCSKKIHHCDHIT